MLLWRFSRFIYSILTTCGKKKRGPSNLREGCRQLFSGEPCGLFLLVLTVANMKIYWTNSYKYSKLVLYKLLTRLSFLLQIFSKEKWKHLHSKHKYASSFVPCTLSWNSLQLSNHTTPVHTWLTQKMSGSITNTFYSCYHSNEIIFLNQLKTKYETENENWTPSTRYTSSTWQGSKSPTIRDVTNVILKERRPSNGRNSEKYF